MDCINYFANRLCSISGYVTSNFWNSYYWFVFAFGSISGYLMSNFLNPYCWFGFGSCKSTNYVDPPCEAVAAEPSVRDDNSKEGRWAFAMLESGDYSMTFNFNQMIHLLIAFFVGVLTASIVLYLKWSKYFPSLQQNSDDNTLNASHEDGDIIDYDNLGRPDLGSRIYFPKQEQPSQLFTTSPQRQVEDQESMRNERFHQKLQKQQPFEVVTYYEQATKEVQYKISKSGITKESATRDPLLRCPSREFPPWQAVADLDRLARKTCHISQPHRTFIHSRFIRTDL